MSTCHWMSHCTPQPAMTLETRSSQSTARLRASVSTGASAASNGRSLARTLTRSDLLDSRLGRRLDGDDLDVEEERLARERMVQVQHHGVVLHGLDGHRPRLAVLTPGEEARAHDVGALRERILRHLGLGLGVNGAVSLVRRDRDLLRLAGFHADEGLVEAGNHLLGALNEAYGLLAVTRVEELALVVLERVLELHGGALLDAGGWLSPGGRHGQQHQERHQNSKRSHLPPPSQPRCECVTNAVSLHPAPRRQQAMEEELGRRSFPELNSACLTETG